MTSCRSALALAVTALGLALSGATPHVRGQETKGDAAGVRFVKKHLFVNPYESTAVADLNRDGHLDIVYGAYWLAGPDFVPRTFRPNHAAKEYLRANSDHVLDVDRDGWPDIIAGGWTEDGIWWFRNPGNSAVEQKTPWEMHQPWQAHLLSKTRGTMEMFALHDYDRDGTPELHSANYRKNLPLEVWRWTTHADGSPALAPFVLGAEGGGHGFAWGDVNGDGREDVLTEIGWYERPAGDPWAGPWKLHPETALPHPSCPFVVKDLNEDGRLDIIFGRGHDIGLYWWEQQPPKPDGTTVWTRHVIDESWSQAHALALGDLDGDKQEDLIAGKCIWAHNGGDPGAADPPAIYYYTWNKSRRQFTRHTIAAPGENIALGRQYDVVDLNRDGRLDLTAPSKLGLWVLFNQGSQPSIRSEKTASGIAYDVQGSGPAVVLISGSNLDRRMWTREAAWLASSHTVIRYDFRAHGQSDTPSKPFNQVDDLWDVLDAAKVENATLIGLSAGSAIALDAALENPKRVARIVLSGPAPSGYVSKERPAFFNDLMIALKAGDYAKANEVILATSVFGSPPESQALVRQMLIDNGRLWKVPISLLKPPRPAVDRLEQVTVPTLVLIGEHDVLQRAPAELLAQRIPNARIVRVPGGGHLLNLTSPMEFEAAVRDFLR